MNRIDVFIGVVGSGKDHSANKLVEAGTHVRVDFKDALLDMTNDLLGYDVRTEYDWFKEAPLGVRQPSNPLIEANLRAAWKEIPGLVIGRVFLQRLGTETMRKRDPDYWVKQWLNKAFAVHEAGKEVTTADCRFPNEVAAIKRYGGHARFVFCDYRSSRYNPSLRHESERMAQTLLGMDLKNGEEILDDHFGQAIGVTGTGCDTVFSGGCVPPLPHPRRQ
jgi:hypothetical protein